MPTAIAVYTSDGCVGRCDARCHEATDPHCTCICGGRNHGCGSFAQAVANNTDAAGGADALELWAKEHGYEAAELHVDVQQQMSLL